MKIMGDDHAWPLTVPKTGQSCRIWATDYSAILQVHMVTQGNPK